MGQWDDKFEKHARKWDSWKMQEYAPTERILPLIIEDKARQRPNHVVFQCRDYPITLGVLLGTLIISPLKFIPITTETSRLNHRQA